MHGAGEQWTPHRDMVIRVGTGMDSVPDGNLESLIIDLKMGTAGGGGLTPLLTRGTRIID